MNNRHVAQQLDTLINERLFKEGFCPPSIDLCNQLWSELSELGLLVVDGSRSTPRGDEFGLHLVMTFTRLLDDPDLLSTLLDRDLISQDEFEWAHDEWEAGGDIEAWFCCTVRRAYLKWCNGSLRMI